jgi:hypothetical protein
VLTLGSVPSASESNARVAAEPFFMSPAVKAPVSIASSAQRRAAAWQARRQAGRQYLYAWPPRRGRNSRSHQAQRTVPLIVARHSILRVSRSPNRGPVACRRDVPVKAGGRQGEGRGKGHGVVKSLILAVGEEVKAL